MLSKFEIIYFPLSGHKVTIEVMEADLYIATCNFNSISYKAESSCKSYAVNEVLSFIREDHSI